MVSEPSFVFEIAFPFVEVYGKVRIVEILSACCAALGFSIFCSEGQR